MPVEIALTPKIRRLLFGPSARYRVAYGGRGSGKSWSFARAILAKTWGGKMRVLCAREIQKSIKDSVHRLLSDQIEALGLSGEFDVLRDEIRCKHNGSEILFTGLANTTVESIKSFEGADICWIEEGQTVSDRSWEILIPTIRKPGSEIWVSFNPYLETDPTFLRFVKDPPPGSRVCWVNWDDNPSIPAELLAEKDYLYRVDPEAAAHVWGGECRKQSDAQVLKGKYSVESFDPRPDLWDGPYQGADWGFATDPSVLVRVWIWERCLYVEYEAYGLGVETDHLAALFDSIPDARNYVTRGDNARPETISYLVRNGWSRLCACSKWSGSVEDGVGHLRGYDKIIIHPRCRHTAEEARLWSYKTDRLTGDVMPQLLDRNNHTWDAIRYALEPVIRGESRSAPRPASDRPATLRVSPQGWMR